METRKREKRPWRSEEDEALLSYIESHGLGNWNLVGKNSGLSRDGRSCRLRWLNQLQPGLKKKLPFSKQEKYIIFSIHATFGNSWSRIAKALPGRTDNAIKNFVNGHIKKCLKTGTIPIYPPQINIKYSTGSSEFSHIVSSDIQNLVVQEQVDLPSIQNTEEDAGDRLDSYLQTLQSSIELVPQTQLVPPLQEFNTSFNSVVIQRLFHGF
ncbi:transcription factor MYB101-like [Phalaenopsis equestris]|uniref:transcription factor MYB101-like n=1 Tax=Phalaenopsis equestris TaxID=78828 RepID=UPI0009E24E32|nr:transcription factor MYB101-like [Phalaenopsis equestris]XP_020599915.1 transcription factor MYB101-like [Phalaenopsis equestris]